MESGTLENLRRAEGGWNLVYVRGDEVDQDSELRFGFATDKAVTEEMLAEMRRRNAEAAMQALRNLRGEGARQRLPAIGGSLPKRKTAGIAGEKKLARRRPGSIGRAETPSEVREAAAREKAERERERGWMKGRGRAPVARQQRKSKARQVKIWDEEPTAKQDGEQDQDVDTEDRDRKDEAEVAMRLLDLQAESRYTEVSLRKLWSVRPQALFDRELVTAIDLMKRHNDLLLGYVERADHVTGEQQPAERSEQDESDYESDEEDAFNPGRAKRRRRERDLTRLVSRGKELRDKSLGIVRMGGAAACRAQGNAVADDEEEEERQRQSEMDLDNAANKSNEESMMQFEAGKVRDVELSSTGRRVLLLLHGMLSIAVDEGDGDSSMMQQARGMRKMLEQMHARAIQDNLSGERMAALRLGTDGAAARRITKRESMWRSHVGMYSSLSGSDEAAEKGDGTEDKMDKYVERTMAMLRSKAGWVGGPPPGSDEETLLEERLQELQAKNARMGKSSVRELDSPVRPAGMSMMGIDDEMDGGEGDSEGMGAEERGRKRQRRLQRDSRMRKAYGTRTDVLTWTPKRGYAGDASDSDGRSLSPVRLGKQFASPANRRKKVEMAAMRRGRGGAANAEVGWVDHVLPSATELSDDYGTGASSADESFWESAVAQQVLGMMATLKDAERAKQEEIVRRELTLGKFEGRMKRIHSSAEHVSVVQERIFQEVHRIRRDVTTNVRGMFKRIAAAREKLQQAKEVGDEDLSKVLVHEAQRELLEVEAEALNLRKRMRRSTSIRIDFMPEYLREFLTKDVSAQAMFDQGRLRQMQAKALEEEQEDMRRMQRMDKRREAEEDADAQLITPILTPDEIELLEGCKEDAKQLCKVLRMAHYKNELATSLGSTEPQGALEAANVSQRFMEQSLIMCKHLRKKLRGRRAKNLKYHLPRYLKNLKDMGLIPLMDAWKSGLIEPSVCEAVDGLERINRQVQMAKNILVKLDRAEEITDSEADQAQQLLEDAVLTSVDVRERARASMLDTSIGGEGIEFWRFPKHVQNLIASEESVIVLWEKGLIDEQVCGWVRRMDEANAMVRQSLKHEARATDLGETKEGLEELQQMDVLQYRADRLVDDLRSEIKKALLHGMQLSRLPPHLQNLIKDDRPHMMLFYEGKTDPIMAVMEYRAEIMLKNKQKSEAMRRKGKLLQDEENRKAALAAAQDMNEATMKEMLKLRAKVMMGGIQIEQLRGPIARVIEEAEEDMEDGEAGFRRARTAMEELGAELGADEELMARIAKLSKRTGKRDREFARIDWSTIVGKYAEDMDAPDPFEGPSGFDCYPPPVCPVPETPVAYPSDPEIQILSGVDKFEMPSLEMVEELDDGLPPGYTNVPVRDDVHRRYPEGFAPPIFDGTEDEDHMGEYGVTATDEEGFEGEGAATARKEPKKYDSDDEEEVVKLGRKKKKAETARTRVQGKTRAGIPLEVRRTITKSIVAAKKTLKLDISNLQLPYIPKQVTDCVWLEQLICDRNLVDELEPSIGRLIMLRVLSLSWNRIESPLPPALFEMALLRELRLDHNQLDVLEPEIVNLSNLTKLRLDDNNLTEVPDTLGRRTNLKYLALDKNNLTDLPKKLAGMYGLNTLTLSRNLFTFIPHAVFSMQRLKVLHVHYNQIPIFPDQISSLKNLADLNFAVNLLTEVRPVVSTLTALTKFDLQRNQIPALGPEMGALCKLKDLTLSHNLLTKLPEEFGDLTSMVKLKLDSNQLSYLPLNLTCMTSLEILDLRNNNFIALAPQLGRVSTLTELRIEGNKLRTPPINICDLGTAVMLRYLDRNDTAIETDELDLTNLTVPKKRILVEKGHGKIRDKYKTIPEITCLLHDWHFPHGWYDGAGLLQRSNLTALRLGGNALRRINGVELSGQLGFCVVPHGMAQGKAPEGGWELDPLTSLRVLTLENNRLVSLPDEFGLLTALTLLDLSANSLEELDGRQWGKLTNLTRLILHSNARLRSLPVQMGWMDRLRWLDVVGCPISSPPPVIVQRGCRPIIDYLRRVLDAQYTRQLDFDGWLLLTVPRDVLQHTTLTYLSLRTNSLTMLSPDIGGLSALRTLHLDNNKLSSLPDEITYLTGLTALSLRNNYFQQIFPEDEAWLGFSQIQSLDLSLNQISVLPALVGSLSRLSALDLSDNRLKTLPFEVYMLTNLTSLNVRGNLLRIPLIQLAEDDDIGVLLEFLRTLANARGTYTSAWSVDGNDWLDLSHRPYRIVPPEAANIPSLTTLKMSDMGLETVDSALASLTNLRVLELHDNSLHYLPDELSALTALTRLSLSRNWFARMPYCLAGMVGLKDLQFDDNQLSVIFGDIRYMTALTELNLSRNCLHAITPALTALTKLVCMDFSSNQITYVPVEFARMTCVRRLSLRDNYITELPLDLHTLSQGALTQFDINNNGLKSPPPEVVSKGTEAMFDYMRRFHAAETSNVLDLSDLGLTYVPADVMRFHQTRGVDCVGLTTLILDGNDLTWLPSYMRTMTTLKCLSLRNCNFTELPYFLGDLRNLQKLDILGNDINVPPDDIVRRGVLALLAYMRAVDQSWWTKELDISGQRFEQVPLEVCSVDSLTSLRMHNQSFSNVPDQIGRLTALIHLNLQQCALVELPESISGLHSLRELVVNNNRLITLPAGIGKCTALTELRAHENVLEELPPEIGNLSMMLDLRLFNNNLLELPSEVGHMRFLPAFRISINQLPKLTEGIAGLESVSDLLIADNFLEVLPPQIGLLTSITRLRATNNRLKELPHELGDLYNMTELAVSDNRIRELPHLGHLTALRNLQVANNPLVCPPDAIVRRGTFAMVNYLRVLHEAEGAPIETVLRGQDAVGAFHELVKLGTQTIHMVLRSRFLVEVPKQVLELPSLVSLDLDGNVIERLPDSFGMLTNLTKVTINYNQVLVLPATMANLHQLVTFEGKYNQLKVFPECLCALRIRNVYLDSNELQELHPYVGGLGSCEVLSVANNNVRKIYEECSSGLTSLRELRLQQNELMVLPESFGCMTRLDFLNMSFNHLVSLPASVSSLTNMDRLLLSYNDLEIRSLAFENMINLEELHLTANRLTGIPHMFARLSKLRALSIGSNQFPVDAHHQYLKSHETVQRWLKINLEAWQSAQGKADKKSQGKRGLPS